MEDANLQAGLPIPFKMATFKATAWREGRLSAQVQFQIDQFLPEQEDAIKAFIERGDLFENIPTGYRKSLIFQSIPVVADILKGNLRGTSVIVVISPIKSLMYDQVEYLGSAGIPAVAIGDNYDLGLVQQVINGYYLIVYCSPERMLSTTTWRGIFNASSFREKLVGEAIGETHCIT